MPIELQVGDEKGLYYIKFSWRFGLIGFSNSLEECLTKIANHKRS